MKQLFKQHKVELRFLGLFLGTYVVLALCYGAYLEYSTDENTPDFITQKVAKQSETLLQNTSYNVQVIPGNERATMELRIENETIGKIVEGCNAVSIIILFVAFIIAFSQEIKKTVLFLFAGSVLIYAFNIVRIAILAIVLYKYPQHQEILHSVVFPGLIYGLVFLLWVVWAKSSTPKKKVHAPSS